MRVVAIGLLGCLLVCCAPKPEPPLSVKQFTLRDPGVPDGDDPMVRGEIQRRLHGAVSNSEREDRLGQYFTLEWHDDIYTGTPTELIFDYQQALTGSRVKREVRGFDPEATSGKAEIHFIGEDFQRDGRVLAWRAALVRDGSELASEQSYLWE